MTKRLPNDCFALPPGVEWTPVDAALAHLESALEPIAEIETLPIHQAAERILAEAPLARRDHPAADNAAVDGYAFAHPGGGVEELNLALRDGRSVAGEPWSGRLEPGEAVRILTGAAMPEGADTVVLQEDVDIGEGRISFPAPRKPGANRRKTGENIRAGAPVLSEGLRLGPAALAQALAGGVETVAVRKPLTVALASTGDELVAGGGGASEDQVSSDKVIDTNRPMLAALIRRLGMEVLDLGAVPDDRAAVEAALDRAGSQAQAVIASGGASGGDEDHMARALKDAAARDPASAGFHQWRIAMKPGRPLAMGLWSGAPVFGLPGNPVAAFVCFALFARPALLRLAGAPWTTPRRYRLPSGFSVNKKQGRREFLRARIGADDRLEKFRSDGSGLIESLVWADGLVDLAHDAGPLAEGEMVEFIPFSELDAG